MGSGYSLSRITQSLLLLLFAFCAVSRASAQQRTPAVNDTLHSPVVSASGHITFRIYAPGADSVVLAGGDIPEAVRQERFVRKPDGVWEVTVGPVVPGAYRYHFIVDNIRVLDPRNPATSESNMDAWSLVVVPGADNLDVRKVPHGAVAEVTYYSSALGRFRRMHVYTPPGYESGDGEYPVFYLLHGAWDTDDAWHSVGRAGFIFDSLFADGKAVPMVVVMPAGHTAPFPSFTPRPSGEQERDEFLEDFVTDIRPYVEKNYRVVNDRQHRAIAGLSMGGAQTLNIAMAHLADYAYIGVYSSGIFELGRRAGSPVVNEDESWEARHRSALDDPDLKDGLRLIWFATGKEDFLLNVSRATVDLLKRHGFHVTYEESEGGHTWINWRDYLTRFTPLLFR